MEKDRTTIESFGENGVMNLPGYDWGPAAMGLTTDEDTQMKRHCTDTQVFHWQQDGSSVVKRLRTGERSLVTAEHALHCLEIRIACRDSSRTGRHIDMKTTFDWRVIQDMRLSTGYSQVSYFCRC
jgi:hypothetical protein